MTRLEKWLPLACLAGFVLLLGLDTGRWHPGFSFFDEGHGMLNHLQAWREGRALPLVIFKGSFHRAAAGASAWIFGPKLWALRLPVLLAFLLENAFLYLLGKRWINQRAGLWAVLVNTVSALSFLRARSLLAYSVLPCEFLALLVFQPKKARPWLALLWGLACAAGLFEYEGWLFALPVLALALWRRSREEKFSRIAVAAGFGAMLAFVWLCSRDDIASHINVRSRSVVTSLPVVLGMIGQALRSFFWGGETFGYMGVSGHSVFPGWALPALALGAWALGSKRQSLWIFLWIAIGLGPMAVGGTAAEPNRLMVAWPALCLLAGAGFSQWPRLLKPGWPAAALGLALLAFGAYWEATAYASSMQAQYPRYYLDSAEQIRVAGKIRQERPQGIELLSELDYESAAPWRFLWEGYGPPQAQGKPVLAAIPWEYAMGQDASWGNWRWDLADGRNGSLLYLEPSPKMALRLRAVQDELLALRKGLPLYNDALRRDELLAYLKAHPQSDPWARTAIIENATGISFMVGDFPKDLMQTLMTETLSSASVYVWIAQKAQFTDPGFARYLYQRALHKDPRRQELKALIAGMAVSH